MINYDYCLSIVLGFAYCMLLYGLCRVLSWACNSVDDEVNNARHDHSVTSDAHVIITIKELPGIEPSVLEAIPVVDFNSAGDIKDSFECVVCLSKLEDGDKARLLPTCNHWFHADCIETWLKLHSSCPICRNIVGSVQDSGTPLS
ncbi:hypothetical protein N665_0478s0025 [Sinapis alba]|nr:hypothetical protein N665_0478s0025 [Sinapis alba]